MERLIIRDMTLHYDTCKIDSCIRKQDKSIHKHSLRLSGCPSSGAYESFINLDLRSKPKLSA